jgi:hypothetical protein
MVTVKINGGAGNQMFQYACARALSLRNRTELRIDPSPLFDITPWHRIVIRHYALNIIFSVEPELNFFAKRQKFLKIPYADKIINKYYPRVLGMIGYWHYIKERQVSFDFTINQLSGNIYLEGYWQTEKYFKDYEAIIRKDFSFRNTLSGRSVALAQDISSSLSVCLNVRRAEIVHNPEVSKVHNVVTKDFYERAIDIMKKRFGAAIKIFVFSDEIEWCRQNLKIGADHIFLDYDPGDVEFRDYLQLMSMCKHFIIPNSSFAWWAAWLSKYEDKLVVGPRLWLKDESINTSDVTPEGWLRI